MCAYFIHLRCTSPRNKNHSKRFAVQQQTRSNNRTHSVSVWVELQLGLESAEWAFFNCVLVLQLFSIPSFADNVDIAIVIMIKSKCQNQTSRLRIEGKMRPMRRENWSSAGCENWARHLLISVQRRNDRNYETASLNTCTLNKCIYIYLICIYFCIYLLYICLL